MRKPPFDPEFVRRAVLELLEGARPMKLALRLGVAHQTLMRWKRKYGDSLNGPASRLKQLKAENAQSALLVPAF